MDRDYERYNAAAQIEADVMGTAQRRADFEVRLRDTRIRHVSEVKSLLSYLRDSLIYKHGVYHMRPNTDIGLKNDKTWHVTPQTLGLEATRRGQTTPRYDKWVECRWS